MFVLSSAYKGALISYLTDQSDPPAIDTIKDLAEKIDANVKTKKLSYQVISFTNVLM